MAAGNEQQQVWKGDVVGQPGRQRVALEMVDGGKGQGVCRRDRLGRHDANDDAADQAGAAGCGDAVKFAEAEAGIGHCLRDDAVEVVEMRAGGDFRHDAAIGTVLVELRQHDVRQNRAIVAYDRGGGFVAAGFDAENNHRAGIACGRL